MSAACVRPARRVRRGSVYVLVEDAKNPNLLFVGTEFGAFATLDRGARWTRLANRLPTVAVHDLVIHPRDGDLVAGTHGRSIWILDDITALQQWTPAVAKKALHAFDSRVATTPGPSARALNAMI